MKPLLIFAHRGEAQAFIQQDSLQAKSEIISGLYEGEGYWLLVTGEGHYAAMLKTAACLGKIEHKVTNIQNLGIGGALDSSLELGNIKQIRTCYHEQYPNQPHPISYSTTENTSITDCITASDRIKDTKRAEYLSHFAQIVDRELWGIAHVCNTFNKPFEAHKLISDQVTKGVACDEIISKAPKWSEQLFEHFQQRKAKRPASKATSLSTLKQIESLGFYMTQSQAQRLQKYLDHLTAQNRLSPAVETEELNRVLQLDKVISQTAKPKKRTTVLLDNLNKALKPIDNEITQALTKATAKLAQPGVQIKYPKTFEKPELTITATISSAQDLQQLADHLSAFDFENVEDIYRGKF